MLESKRLFFAVNIPEKAKKEIFSHYSKSLPSLLKIVPEQNLHFTLLFLGNIPETALQEIRQKAEKVKQEKFTVQLGGIGEFENKVLWVGALSGREELSSLNLQLSESFESKQKFQPHLTIARNHVLEKEEFKSLANKLQKNKVLIEFEVNSFELMESSLRADGAHYSQLVSFLLNH